MKWCCFRLSIENKIVRNNRIRLEKNARADWKSIREQSRLDAVSDESTELVATEEEKNMVLSFSRVEHSRKCVNIGSYQWEI